MSLAETGGRSMSEELERIVEQHLLAADLRQTIREEFVAFRQTEIRMSAASDALMQGLADLSAKLATSVSDIETARAEAEAAQAAKDDVTFNAANERVKTMLANLGPHVEAIGQMASAVADGAGTSAVAAPPVSSILDAPSEPVGAAADASVRSDGEASAEDAAATNRRKRS